ncbi:MAG: hypothetical protein NXI32_12410 [bacterium]|nr:hypothetical protein [bacterium]
MSDKTESDARIWALETLLMAGDGDGGEKKYRNFLLFIKCGGTSELVASK